MITAQKTLFIIIPLFLVGLIIHLYCPTREYALYLTTPFLLFIGFFTLLGYAFNKNKQFQTLGAIIIIFGVTLFFEILGIRTGKIFGEYQYGTVLGLKFMGVPMVIGLNWVLLVFAARSIVYKFIYNTIRKAFILNITAGILLVLVDYFIEPVAVALNYWQWQEMKVPIQNYLAWFLISQIVYLIADYLHVEPRSALLDQIYMVMLAYFIILRFFLEECG